MRGKYKKHLCSRYEEKIVNDSIESIKNSILSSIKRYTCGNCFLHYLNNYFSCFSPLMHAWRRLTLCEFLRFVIKTCINLFEKHKNNCFYNFSLCNLIKQTHLFRLSTYSSNNIIIKFHFQLAFKHFITQILILHVFLPSISF